MYRRHKRQELQGVAATKGTYAERGQNENEHIFVEISQDTAVLTPLPEKYTDADGVLTADVIGFNRTYQWYGSFFSGQ